MQQFMNIQKLRLAQRNFDLQLPEEDKKQPYIEDCMAEQAAIDPAPHNYNLAIRRQVHSYIAGLHQYLIINHQLMRELTCGGNEFDEALFELTNQYMDKIDLLIAERRYAQLLT